jgi:hypothetical protein
LLKLAVEHRITVDHVGFALDQVGVAWAAQVAGPHAKVTASIRSG